MSFKVFATNQPDVELDVEEAELVDLARQGLLVHGKGDISERGRLKRTVAGDASPELNANLPATDTTTTTTTGQGA
jgi:hypothetical protein